MNKKVRNLLIVCLALIAVGGIGYVVYYMVSLNQNEDVYQEAREVAKPEPAEEPAAEEPETVIPIDFEALWEMNPDVYAWIEIPGTQVDYPILQSPTDDGYYLNHNLDGSEGYPGSIYTESVNGKEFEDFNTVIYGHNMKDGTMFGDLHEYEDSAFLEENSQVIIYTPEKKLTYQIFAAVVYDDRHIMKSFNFEAEDGRQEFLDSLNTLRDMRSYIDSDVAVTTSDRIITMSTCIGSEDNHRYLVEAVLINEE